MDLVIVGGGDGTLKAAVDSLVQYQLPLGILPLGTANDLARTLSIPTSTLSLLRGVFMALLGFLSHAAALMIRRFCLTLRVHPSLSLP